MKKFLLSLALIMSPVNILCFITKAREVLFTVQNATPHKVYIRMGFSKNKCAAFTQDIPANTSAQTIHKGCKAVNVSGYIYIDGKQVPLVPWNVFEEERIRSQWIIKMNKDGKTATIIGKNFPTLFTVINRTPHNVYIRMGFDKNKCAAFTANIPPSLKAEAAHKDCSAKIVSGYIYIDGKQVPLMRWTGSTDKNIFGHTWVVDMNDARSATVHYDTHDQGL